MLAVASIWNSAVVGQVIPATPADDARAAVRTAQQKEYEVLKGVEWTWTVEKGKARSPDDALQGMFDDQQPIDTYHCRWLSNDGAFLYESIAQQPRRKLQEDAASRAVLTTDGSNIYLCTRNSRLEFDPAPFAGFSGAVENKQHGMHDRWGPGSIPVHGGSFGLGRIKNLLQYISDPANEIGFEEGLNFSRVKSKILRIKKKDRTELVYYFSESGLNLLQYEQFISGVRRSQMVVLETSRVSRGGTEIELPSLVMSCHYWPDDDVWNVSRMKTKNVRLAAADLSDMAIPVSHPRLTLNPMGRVRTLDFEGTLTAANLDSVVETFFAKLKK